MRTTTTKEEPLNTRLQNAGTIPCFIMSEGVTITQPNIDKLTRYLVGDNGGEQDNPKQILSRIETTLKLLLSVEQFDSIICGSKADQSFKLNIYMGSISLSDRLLGIEERIKGTLRYIFDALDQSGTMSPSDSFKLDSEEENQSEIELAENIKGQTLTLLEILSSRFS
jgi:hypothetical protein